ncbi:hypothetical protein N7457_007855 [Penicillium paradoxum]|uniref:uncharacterized protein n=1 Tax=Penicillium paradoxum TaxID=176176 RepID=UPI0025474546|nr:uncharacterized protein N7457_007855 [Penicillium paradoxum]KAJ5772959.1 hypothetical protein N7457_007855 [Penicillium paradoxum]
MHRYKALALLLAHFTLSRMLNITCIGSSQLTTVSKTEAAACPAGGCGTAPACVLTDTCTTATFVSPSTTTITTCVPTPTCMGPPVNSVTQPRNAARGIALPANVDQQTIHGRFAARIMGPALSMTIAVMGTFALTGSVVDHDLRASGIRSGLL